MRGLKFSLQVITGVLATGAILAVLMPALGCGGSSTTPPPPPPGNTKTQLRIGDAPVDSVIAFEVTIASPIVVTPSGGGSPVNITVAANNRLELSHMAGKLEPLSVLNVPQGSFTSAAITITNPEVTFLTGVGTQTQTIQGTTSQVTVTFNPVLTIGTSPAVLNVDLNVANSLATDANGNITGFDFKSSSFNITTAAVAAEAEQEDDTGELEDVTGLVASVSGSNFTLNVGQSGAQLTFATDNTTAFSDGAALATMTNTIVKVEGVTKSDGTLFAKEVEGIENQNNGAELEGLITAVTGNPAVSLDVLAQDGIGAGMDDTKVGTTFTALVGEVQASKYRVDLGKVDTSNLGQVGGPPAQSPNFPFDATTIHSGQRVEMESAITVASGTITADQVKLEQQALSGTVSNFTAGSGGAATFDLNLPPDGSSYLTILAAQVIVHVFQQPGTDVHNLAHALTNGDTVRVRGLLFWTGTTFNMIARRITP